MSTQFTNRQWRLPNEENKSKVSNYSMDFDGSSQYVQTSSLSIGNTFTFSCWLNVNSFTQNQQCFLSSPNYYTSGYNGNFIIRLTNSSSINFYSYNSNNISSEESISCSVPTITTGSWNHFVITNNGTTAQYYWNGSQLTTTGVNTKTLDDLTNGLVIGDDTTNVNNPFNGQIDAVAIFNYALSSSQITTLYGSSSTGIGNPMAISGGGKPVAYYNLGDKSAFNNSNYLVPNSSLKDYVFDFELNTASSADEYVSIFPNNELNGLTNVTFAGWFYARATNVYDGIYSNRSSGGYVLIYPDFVTTNTFRIRAVTQANGVTSYVHSDYVSINQWYHFALVCENGSTLKIYINGEDAVYTSGTNFSSIVQTTFFKIGSDGGTRNWNGFFSNFQVWDTNLSSTDAETLYNNGSPLQNLNDIPQNSNLKAWWKLDASATYDSSTTTWTIPDDSTNSNTGTSSGMTQANLVQSDLSFTSGYSPYALDFDGANDYIDCGNDSTLNMADNGTDSFTFSFWIKRGSTNNEIIISKQVNGGSYNGFETSLISNKIRVFLGSFQNPTAYLQVIATNTITGSDWKNVVITYDGSQNVNGFNIYINKVPETLSALKTDIPSGVLNSANFQISGRSGLTLYDGSISNLSYWNTALTQAQVTEIYNEGVPSNLNNHSAYSNLVSWWQLGSNSSFNTNWTVLDEKGSNNGTSVNMTEADIVDGVGSSANGLSSGMGGDEVIGDAPYSTANSLSVNMDVLDRVEDTPS